MPKLETSKFLKANTKLTAEKLEVSKVKQHIQQTIEKQETLLNLKVLDDRCLKLVVQL